MATTIITGRALTLTIDSLTYDDQTATVQLVQENDQQRYELLSGAVDKTIDTTFTLEVTFMADWGTTGSLCRALWDAANTAPDTALAFTFESNGDSFAGDVLPTFPPVGGTGKDAQEVTVTLTGVGSVAKTDAV